MFAGFDGASGGVHVFICVVFMVMCGATLTIRRLCELGCIAGILVAFIGSVVGMSRCLLQMVIWVTFRLGDGGLIVGEWGRGMGACGSV